MTSDAPRRRSTESRWPKYLSGPPLVGPGIPALHGYTAEVRAAQSRAQRGKPHPQRREECSCGKVITPGPMQRHVNATGHRVVRRLPRA